MEFNDYFVTIPLLKTDRLTLRSFCSDDIDTYLGIIHDPQVQQFLGGGVNLFNKEPHISNWLNNINGRLLKTKTVITWCVELTKENKVIGRIDLGGFAKKSMAEISYYLSPEYWGMGFATEAVKEVTHFGFDALRLHRIQALVMSENIPSIKVLRKAGFSEEGILKKYLIGKEFHDTVMLAAIREQNLNYALGTTIGIQPFKNAPPSG
ncbi:GNAT family N-acetyltransferase [Paenibacillus apis]|uniref:N-acetyltransferase n=1 Tax=Paenibacillus apis TaxID=1792174 RepID=A0A919Y8L0_9BACL|nr:GNAT family protein [Paenibacillus apis]GIO44345.1 N-acetyltransferase [Paenibacillus apis]